MNRIFKILTATALFSFSSLFSSTAYAQDAEYNLIRRTYKVNADGSVDIGFRKEIKLLRNRAITAYADKGETFILYNPDLDRLTINESYTIRPDGSRVQTPKNAFIDQLPSECQSCGRYNGMRERVVVHTALEYNCTVVLDYTIHHVGTSGWSETVTLAEDCPVKKYEIIVDANNQDFNVTSTDNSKCKTLKDGHSYHLVASNLKQTSIEYNDATEYPHITVDLLPGKERKAIDLYEELPEADNVVAELYERDTIEWADKIRNYVADNIRTINIERRHMDNKTASAKETFMSGCGTPEEKCYLLAAMLRRAGISAISDGLKVSMTVSSQGVRLPYTLSDKRPIHLDGSAVDEQRTINITESLAWNGKEIGGGYSQMSLPSHRGSINIDPTRLVPSRKAPLKVRNCNERYHYTIQSTSCRLVKPVNINYTKSGVGSMRISVKQLPDGTIDVVRQLSIDVADGIVTAKQYKAFRQMMQDWWTHKTITIQAKGSGSIGH